MAGETQKVIVLTGASGGIGQALAREYAGPGIYFALIARDEARLEALLTEIRELGADGEISAIDIRDREALHGYLSNLDARHPVDLVIANAGVTAGLGPNRTRETNADSDRQIDVNYRGVVNTLTGLVDNMQKRRQWATGTYLVSGRQCVPCRICRATAPRRRHSLATGIPFAVG